MVIENSKSRTPEQRNSNYFMKATNKKNNNNNKISIRIITKITTKQKVCSHNKSRTNLLLVQLSMLSRSTKQRLVPIMASMLRHIEKCRCGPNDCPIPLCALLKANGNNDTFTVHWNNNQWIEFNLPSVRVEYLQFPHYAKCREVIHSSEMMDNPISHPYQHGCYCAAIKQCMRRIAQCFPQQPLSLQLLAICAIPDISPHLVILHPDGEDVLRMVSMSQRVQHWWREILQRRGLYRIKVCKYYKMRGWIACRYGVQCRFAHGRHDIRHKFVPSVRD
jgi:hypothetical protein